MGEKIILQHGDLIEFDYENQRARGIIMGFEIDEKQETCLWIFVNKYSQVLSVKDTENNINLIDMENPIEEGIIGATLETLEIWNYKRVGIGFSPREMTNFMIVENGK